MTPLIVLVEGDSDRIAVETLAARRGVPMAGVSVLAMGGITNIGTYLDRYAGSARLAGLYDAGEERFVRRALERAGLGAGPTEAGLAGLGAGPTGAGLAGLGAGPTGAGLAGLGFEVCVADLEDELIRALGAEAVERVLAATGRLRSFRTMQRQPAQRERTVEQQLHRFFGSSAGKIRYARLLVEALDLDRVPAPLDRLVDRFRPVDA